MDAHSVAASAPMSTPLVAARSQQQPLLARDGSD
jgi:hypothetical protein